MRLIHTETLELKYFVGRDKPDYAILSHCWGNNEVTLQDYHILDKAGPRFKKILDCCQLAKADKLEWAWVDTCCIDKTSSAELSEAINSMYRWYQDAKVCYALLEDATPEGDIKDCRWFTRGWTLQELLAPKRVLFLGADLQSIGSRNSLSETIATITGIDEDLLHHSRVYELRHRSIAERMSWASRRVTTRSEDEAYCLLGLFEINMPLLYDEGTRAFLRLQKEIIAKYDDDSILAWGCPSGPRDHSVHPKPILAPSPAHFRGCNDIKLAILERNQDPMTITSQGLGLFCSRGIFLDFLPSNFYSSGIVLRRTNWGPNCQLELQCVAQLSCDASRPVYINITSAQGILCRTGCGLVHQNGGLRAKVPASRAKIVLATEIKSRPATAESLLSEIRFSEVATERRALIMLMIITFVAYLVGALLPREMFEVKGPSICIAWAILMFGLKLTSHSTWFLLGTCATALGQTYGYNLPYKGPLLMLVIPVIGILLFWKTLYQKASGDFYEVDETLLT